MNSLQTTQPTAMVPTDVEAIDLQQAFNGDLQKLSPDARLKYYGAVCNSMGLNPLTKPFTWITFQGKLQLYANVQLAEQLRAIHKVSLEILERKVEFGCLVVRIRATSAGRFDESLAAVPFSESMAGKDIAMMKVETKAKRRVTFSICGFGFLADSDYREDSQATAKLAKTLDGDESAFNRAEKLNAQLSSIDKSEAIPVAAVTTPLPIQEPVVFKPQAPVDDAPKAIEPQLSSVPVHAANQSVGLLTPDEVIKLQVAFSACPQPDRAVEFCVYRQFLKPGAELETMPRHFFKYITERTPMFVKMVTSWKGNLEGTK